ncbi:MAG: hypothetical protein Q8M15_12095 [Bacteroidota bacterium]|nr:hypothetical protein [Bacteroidota bacterium]
MRKFYPAFIIPVCIALMGLNACKTKEVMIPSYLYIKPAVFTTKADLSQGQASATINDIWVFENEVVRGNFALKTTIPIQREGQTTIRISPGIKHSGNSEQRVIYPMYTTFVKPVNLVPNQVDTLEPSFTYVENTVFPLKEDFESSGFAFEYNPQYKQTGDSIISDNGLDAWLPGKTSGKVVLNSGIDKTVLEIYSQVFKNLPRASPIYLEIDYKCNVPFVFGLYATDLTGNTSKIPVYVINEKSNWNKIYFNLDFEIASRPAGTSFRFFFQFRNSLENPVPSPNIWLDNIKIVYLD